MHVLTRVHIARRRSEGHIKRKRLTARAVGNMPETSVALSVNV